MQTTKIKILFTILLVLLLGSANAFLNAACSPTTIIAVPFTKDGTGTFCYETTSLCTYINSWNLTTLEINGTSYLNRYVDSSTIAPVSGKYIITYVSAVAYGHFEIAGACGTVTATTVTRTATATTLTRTATATTITRTATATRTSTTLTRTATATRTSTTITRTATLTSTPTAVTRTATATSTTPTRTATAVSGTVVYSASGGKLLKDGVVIPLYGLNWFGMETSNHVLHGLWTGRQLADFLADIRSKGFNALRLPLSPETINSGFLITSGPYSGEDCLALCGKDGRTALEYTLAKAQAAGVYVLLDFHTCSPANLGSALTGNPTSCSGYSTAAWLADLKTMASLSKIYTNVVGIDLCNEPWSLTYTDWIALASQGGQAVLSVNPNVTVWVEGVGNLSPNGGYVANWGENLYESTGTISGIPTNRLVWSPHCYGPSVAVLDYFSAPTYPSNLPGIFDTLYGHLIGTTYTVIMGEFGGKYTGDDKVFQDALVAYLISKGAKSTFWWSLNPNSGDTGGVYLDDWITWNTDKLTLLQKLMN